MAQRGAQTVEPPKVGRGVVDRHARQAGDTSSAPPHHEDVGEAVLRVNTSGYVTL